MKCRAWRPKVTNLVSMSPPGEDRSQWGLCRNTAVGDTQMCSECIDLLANSPDTTVRSLMAAYDRAPLDTLRYLSLDPDYLVASSAQANLRSRGVVE